MSNAISKLGWFNELHEAGLKALSRKWQSDEEIKNKMPKYKDKAYDIMRDLQFSGFAECKQSIEYDYCNRRIKKCTTYFRR